MRLAVATVVSSGCNSRDLRRATPGTPAALQAGMATTTKTLAAVLTLCFLATGCEQGETVGPRGGTVMSDDGRVTLDIPEGALTSEVEITIEVVEDAPAGAIGTVYAIEPAGLALLAPATLTFDLAIEDEARAAGTEDSLAGLEIEDLVLLAEKADLWKPMSDREVDADAEIISASVLWFSSYALASR